MQLIPSTGAMYRCAILLHLAYKFMTHKIVIWIQIYAEISIWIQSIAHCILISSHESNEMIPFFMNSNHSNHSDIEMFMYGIANIVIPCIDLHKYWGLWP